MMSLFYVLGSVICFRQIYFLAYRKESNTLFVRTLQELTRTDYAQYRTQHLYIGCLKN